MNLPKHDPELASRLSGAEPEEEFSRPYTIEGYRNEIWNKDRRIAKLRNRIQGAIVLKSKDAIVRELEAILKEV